MHQIMFRRLHNDTVARFLQNQIQIGTIFGVNNLLNYSRFFWKTMLFKFGKNQGPIDSDFKRGSPADKTFNPRLGNLLQN